MAGTGSPRADAQGDFARARRKRALERLAARMRRAPGDVDVILPYDEVIEALGFMGRRDLGLQSIRLDSIVGTVGRSRDFDRAFRPTSQTVRPRWERIAAAYRRGESFPPIDVLRVGDLHFVVDGHHRVSVARQLGHETIDAHVTEVLTRVRLGGDVRAGQLALKSHERLFFERVPLPAEHRARIRLDDEWRYAALAEGVEAWGFRRMQDEGRLMSRDEVARAWFEEEYEPLVELLDEAGLVGRATETEAYMSIVALRYLLLRTHQGIDDELLERLLKALEQPPAGAEEDTLVHQLRQELK